MLIQAKELIKLQKLIDLNTLYATCSLVDIDRDETHEEIIDLTDYMSMEEAQKEGNIAKIPQKMISYPYEKLESMAALLNYELSCIINDNKYYFAKID
jgi:hypothetical protein